MSAAPAALASAPAPYLSTGGGGGGDTTTTTTSSASDASRLIPSEVPRVFLSSAFSAAPYVSSILAQVESSSSTSSSSTSPATITHSITDSISLLDVSLKKEIESNHNKLMENVKHLSTVDDGLLAAKLRVDALQSSARRIRQELAEPYLVITQKTAQLRTLCSAGEVLRHTVDALKTVQKLRTAMASGSTLDLNKAARAYQEASTALNSYDLSGVDVAQVLHAELERANATIKQGADTTLRSGMETLSQSDVGAALQVYHALGELAPAARAVVERYKRRLDDELRAKLGDNTPTAAGPGRGHSAKEWSAGLWSALNSCLDTWHGAIVAVWHLQRVLEKKREAGGRRTFASILVEEEEDEESLPPPDSSSLLPPLLRTMWEGSLSMWKKHLSRCARHTSLKEELTASYVKFERLLVSYHERIVRDTLDARGGGDAAVPTGAAGRAELLACATSFANGYLARSLARCSDAAHAMFGKADGVSMGGAVPSLADGRRFVAAVQEELREAASAPAGLSARVASGVAKSLRVLADKAEMHAASGEEQAKVGGLCSAAQQRSAVLFTHLQAAHLAAVSSSGGLSEAARAAVQPGMDRMREVALELVLPWFTGLVAEAEKRIVKVHGDASLTNDGCSSPTVYCKELTNLLAHFHAEFLRRLPNTAPGESGGAASAANTSGTSSSAGGSLAPVAGQLARALCRRAAARIVALCLRHMALRRPIGMAGRHALAADCAALESAVEKHLCAVTELGVTYRALRAFRGALRADSVDDLNPGCAVADDLPSELLLHHILCARWPTKGEGVKLPMDRVGLSVSQYSLWLDKHGPNETVDALGASIETYENRVKSDGDRCSAWRVAKLWIETKKSEAAVSS